MDERVHQGRRPTGDHESIDAETLQLEGEMLDDSESAMNPVSGDFVTTANFAVVVRPVPTRGAHAKTRAFAGEKGSTPGGVLLEQARAEADAAETTAQTRRVDGGDRCGRS